MMEVRPAIRRDLGPVVQMGFAMHQETEFRSLGFDFAKAEMVVDKAIAEDHRCLFVAEDKRELVGMIGGYVCEPWYSKDLMLNDQILYVRPERRGGRAALHLLRAFLTWADEYPQPLAMVSMATSSGMEHADKAGKFLEHFGFIQIGNVYRRKDHV